MNDDDIEIPIIRDPDESPPEQLSPARKPIPAKAYPRVLSEDLYMVMRKFAPGFISEQIGNDGPVMVERVLRAIEKRIASGNLQNVNRALAWKIYFSTKKAMLEDDSIRKRMGIKRDALILLLQSGLPYMLGNTKITHTNGLWFVSGKPWSGSIDLLHGYMVKVATAAFWKVRPLSDQARERLRDYPMLSEDKS